VFTITNIAMGDEGLQISYVREADVDTNSGISEMRSVNVPYAILDQSLLNELNEAALAIIEEARVIRMQPADALRRD